MTPSWLHNGIARIEGDERLDRLAALYDRVADWVSEGQRGEALRGEWLGHALHPLLTDLPLGCWAAAGLLDIVGGRQSRTAAQRLVGMGLLLVPVTAASGSADYATITNTRTRRVGVVHAFGNTAVAVAYWKSWRARARNHHATGVAWGLVGGTLAWGTGYLGGHLSFGRGVGQGMRGMNTDDFINRNDAAALLDVTPDRIDTLVSEGLLDAAGPGRFRRTDVLAAKLQGG